MSKTLTFSMLIKHYLEFLVRARKSYIVAILGTLTLMLILPYSIMINQLSQVQDNPLLVQNIKNTVKAMILILDPLMVALIGSAILMQITNEERTKRILEYTIASTPLRIVEFIIVRGLGMTVILLILAFVSIVTQMLWLYTSIALHIDAFFLCLLTLSTTMLTLGLSFLSATIPIIIPPRYAQLITLAIVAILNIVFFIAIKGATSISGNLSSNLLFKYNFLYIILGLALILIVMLLIKYHEDKIAMNIITSD